MPPPMVPLLGAAAPAAAAGISAGAGSIISSGLSMLGGLFGSRNKGPTQAEINAREDSRYQRASKDAKLAGLHPLFALGAGGAGSPQFIAGQSETGSTLGDVLKGASRGVTNYQRATKSALDPLSTRLRQLQIQNAEIDVAKNRISLVDMQKATSDDALTTSESYYAGQDREFSYPHDKPGKPPGQYDPPRIVGEHRERTLILPNGREIIVGAHSSAEDFQKWFGEWVGDTMGMWAYWEALKRSNKKPLQDMADEFLKAQMRKAASQSGRARRAKQGKPFEFVPLRER